MTREEAIEKFREHWRWIAAEPGRDKHDYPPFENEAVVARCYLCEYCKLNDGRYCEDGTCIIAWPG